MHIGLIGGIGPAATDLYYRSLIAAMKTRGAPLDLTIVHADAATLVANFEAKRPGTQAAIYKGLAERMVAAGAEAMAISSIGGHFCIDAYRPISPLPVIEMTEALNDHLRASPYKTVGILGADAVMESRFYGAIDAVEMLAPEGDELAAVHRAYIDMAVSGVATEDRRRIFFDAGARMRDRGAEAILLGGTDLFLAFDDHDPGFPVFDCALVHVEAIADVAAQG